MQKYSLSEIAKETGKAPLFISNIQKTLKLPILKDGYSKSYLLFVQRVVAMHHFSIALDRICELLETEKKILKLLHIDSTSMSATWYLDGYAIGKERANHLNQSLLLTNFNLGFSMDGVCVQDNLNFGEQAPELFKGAEMGEDVRRILSKYDNLLQRILQDFETEIPAIEHALKWAKSVCNKESKKPTGNK